MSREDFTGWLKKLFAGKGLDTYYEFKGWNSDGIPTKESLDELGLDYVSEEFIKRGILTDGEDAPAEETSTEKEQA